MARGYTTRRLEVFALHAHTATKDRINYETLFQLLSRIRKENRIHEADGKIIAIPTLQVKGVFATLVAYEGERGLHPLVYNTVSATERVERLQTSEIMATRTHAIINLSTREAVIEYNHRGAKAYDIALTLQGLAQSASAYRDITIELNPVVTEDFAKQIDRFDRIRVASVKVSRPNFDWNATYNELTKAAKESDAHDIEVSMVAERGGSLSKKQGLLKFIKSLTKSEVLSIFKSATITGEREGEREETTLSLSHYIEHQKVRVRRDESGHVDDKDVTKQIGEYINSRIITTGLRQ